MAQNIKDKEIFILFADFDVEIGGVGSTVLGRASSLAEKGYDITLLNVTPVQNFDYTLEYFREKNELSKKVKFINLYQYYARKNNPQNLTKKVAVEDEDAERVVNPDQSVVYNYYSSDELVKSETYIDDCLVLSECGKNSDFYTKDGFNYLQKRGWQYRLINRDDGSEMEFKSNKNLLYHFMREVCFSKKMPIIVCDSTKHWYNIDGIDLNEAYKIASMHGNPYDNGKVSPKVNHLKHLDEFDVLVLLTNEVSRDLSREFDKSKFRVIPNFADDEFLKDLNVEKDQNKISIFSRISPEKQMSDAIRAFKIVSEENDDAHLDIYGRALVEAEKEEYEKLKALVGELDLENRVNFMGYIPDVRAEMQKSLCTLLTSKHEGLPLMLLESMASSTPVIAYDLKYGPDDLIDNGTDGIIVKKNDIDELAGAMSRMLENPDDAIKMGMKAKDKIRRDFSIESVSRKWEDLFEEVIASRNSKGIFSKIKKLFK